MMMRRRVRKGTRCTASISCFRFRHTRAGVAALNHHYLPHTRSESHSPALHGNVNFRDSCGTKRAIFCDGDDDGFKGSQDDSTNHELTESMSLVSYNSTMVVAGSDEDNRSNRRRSGHDVDKSSLRLENYDALKTRSRRRWSLMNRDEYTLLLPHSSPNHTEDFEQKVHITSKATISEFRPETEEECLHGVESHPWKLHQIPAEHELYPEAGDFKEEKDNENGHDPSIKSSGRKCSKLEISQEKKGVFGYLMRYKKRFTEHLVKPLLNREVSERKTRYSDQREEGSPLKLQAAIKSRKWQGMVRKRSTSASSSSQEVPLQATNEYYNSGADEEPRSMTLEASRAPGYGEITEYIERSSATNSQECDVSIQSDSDQQGTAYTSSGWIVPFISTNNYMNHNPNNVALNDVSSRSKSSISPTPMVCRSGNGVVSDKKDVIKAVELVSGYVGYVSDEQDAMETVEVVREELIKRTDEGLDTNDDKELDPVERSASSRRLFFWNRKKFDQRQQKEGKWKYSFNILSLQKKPDTVAGDDGRVVTPRQDAKQHGSWNMKQRSKGTRSKFVNQDEEEEGDYKVEALIQKIADMEKLKSVDKAMMAEQWPHWTCLASPPLLREFQEAIENAHFQMRMLAGFLALEKDTEIMALCNNCGAESVIYQQQQRSNVVTDTNILEDRRNHIFNTIIEAGIQISARSICFRSPWHMKYALDACVNSIFFKPNLHPSSKKNSTNYCAEYGGVSTSLSSSPLVSMSSSLDYNPKEGFERFLSVRREATEVLIRIEMEKWSDSLRSIFLACAVSCFHVYTLITEGSRSCTSSVRILHPLHGYNFDESTMDPLDSVYDNSDSKSCSIDQLHHRGKVAFTIFSGFALNIDCNDDDQHQHGKILCKSQVYLASKAAPRSRRIGME